MLKSLKITGNPLIGISAKAWVWDIFFECKEVRAAAFSCVGHCRDMVEDPQCRGLTFCGPRPKCISFCKVTWLVHPGMLSRPYKVRQESRESHPLSHPTRLSISEYPGAAPVRASFGVGSGRGQPCMVEIEVQQATRAGGCPAKWLISGGGQAGPRISPTLAIFLTTAWNGAVPGQTGRQVYAPFGKELCASHSTESSAAQTLQVEPGGRPGQVRIAHRLDLFLPR